MKKTSNEEIQRLLDVFGRLDVEETEKPCLVYKHIGILDVFPKCLSEEEAVRLLGSEHSRNNESKYVKYFQRCERSITGPIYIMRRPIFSGLNKINEDVYRIEDINELVKIIMKITREECFYNLFFSDVKTVVIGNFDLSWPIYCNSEEFFRFKEIAREVKLFIRTN